MPLHFKGLNHSKWSIMFLLLVMQSSPSCGLCLVFWIKMISVRPFRVVYTKTIGNKIVDHCKPTVCVECDLSQIILIQKRTP